MIDSFLNYSVADSDWTLANKLLAVFVAFCAGVIVSIVYYFTQRKRGYEPSFPVTLIILPVVVAFIIMIIGDNTGRALSIAGIFALTRFRSDPKSPADISYIFSSVGAGLAAGAGSFGLSLLLAVFVSVIMIVVHFIKYGEPKNTQMKLRVIIPENLNFQNVFDDILEKYTVKWEMERVKTTDFGTMIELMFLIDLKKDADQKALLDELRCRNGNLTITLTSAAVYLQQPTK